MIEFGKPRIILPQSSSATEEAVAVDITSNYQRSQFVVALGSLVGAKADAIVCRASPRFGPSLGGRIFSMLKVNAGVRVFYEAQAKAGELLLDDGVNLGKGYQEFPQGYALSTSAGELSDRFKYIIHVNLMIKDGSSPTEHTDAVRISVANCAEEAEKLSLRCIAIPAIGALSEVALEESLGGALAGVKTFYSNMQSPAGLDKIVFVAHGEPNLKNAQMAKGILEQQLSILA